MKILSCIKYGLCRAYSAASGKAGVIDKLLAIPHLKLVRIPDTSITLACITLIPGKTQYTIKYKGVSLFDRSKQVKTVTLGRVLETVEQIGFEEMDYIWSKGYKLRFQPVNMDLLDSEGQMIFRGSPEELKSFIKFHNDTNESKLERLKQAILKFKLESGNVYNPEETGKIFGVEIPPSANGLSPDFSKTPQFLYQKNEIEGVFKIKMSGDRDEDKRIANKIANLDKTPPGYTWHHLDDFDPVTGECTMQLVETAVHKQIKVGSLKGQIQPLHEVLLAGKHVGAVAIWEDFYKVFYK